MVDPNNPQYGGINITHDPVPSGDEIGHGECPPDYERGGAPGDRTVTYNIQCDKKGKKGSLQVLKFEEGPACHYTLYLRSFHGCAVKYNGPDSFKSAGGAIAGGFFGGMFLAVLICGGLYYYFAVMGGSAGGFMPFGSSGGGGASSSSADTSAFTGGSGGASTPSSSAYTAVGAS